MGRLWAVARIATVDAVTTYRAVCHRSGRWWAVDVPEVFGVHTQARRLDQVAAMARDAVAATLEVDEADVDIEVVLA